MKVFVRNSDLALGGQPPVLAFYPDDSSISDDAHGEGVTVLNLPESAVTKEKPRSGRGVFRYVLVHNWRNVGGEQIANSEAARRIKKVLSESDQLAALWDILGYVLKYGIDATKWPPEALARKNELDEKFNYVQKVKERAKVHSPNMPLQPASDAAWPVPPPSSGTMPPPVPVEARSVAAPTPMSVPPARSALDSTTDLSDQGYFRPPSAADHPTITPSPDPTP